ncbi:MAG: tetratricopeptide repeat protein [Rhodospirillaceae bacterium]|nr:tetratricopeptide repeat protein [Rhodospirillaceae bacterium]
MIRASVMVAAGLWASMALAQPSALFSPDPVAITDEANRYFSGIGVVQDDERAATLYREAAEKGYARAQHNLGVMYAEGRGVVRDMTLAIEWYRKAVAQAYVPAMTSLGIAYAEGRGVAADPATAARLLQMAADAGDRRAKEFLLSSGLARR